MYKCPGMQPNVGSDVNVNSFKEENMISEFFEEKVFKMI